MKICLFGAASNNINPDYITAVEALGEKLAEQGHSLVFGAGGHGLMGAAARGVARQNGAIIGVIPSFFKEENVEQIFPHCTQLIYTDTMAARKAKMEELADAFLIVPGGIGTFEEFFEVLTLKQLGRHTKPIAIYDIQGYYKTLEALLDIAIKEGFLRENCRKLYHYGDDPNAALSYIENDLRLKHQVKELKNG